MNKLKAAWGRAAVVGVLGAAAIFMMGCSDKTGSAGQKQTPTSASTGPISSQKDAPPPSTASAGEPLASPLASPLKSPVEGAMKIGVAGVDRVTLRVEPGSPGKVTANVSGYLGDACTQLGAVTQVRDGSVVHVNLGTLRPVDRMCAQVVKDFELDVVIEAAGLPVGTYSVDVNGVIAQFDVDDKGPLVK